MNKRKEIETTERIVKKILIKDKKARNSDNYLYIKVIKYLNNGAEERPFNEVMINLKKMGLPCYETVSRTRRRIQAEHPELWSDATIKRYREEAEKDFEDYSRSWLLPIFLVLYSC